MNFFRGIEKNRRSFSFASIPLHGLLFGLYPILSLISTNLGQLDPLSAIRSATLVIVIWSLICLVTWLLGKTWISGSALASGAFLLFFSYGHVYGALEGVHVLGVQVGRHRHLLPLWVILSAGVIWAAFKKPGLIRTLNPMLNAAAVVAIAFPLYTWIAFIGQTNYSLVQADREPQLALSPTTSDPEQLPDVYYIITDAYARGDVLKGQFGFDNSEFYEFLWEQGFYVAELSQANYLFTHLSLTSSLNSEYLQTLVPNYRQGDELPISNSWLRNNLESRGYQTVSFPSGWVSTEWTDADYFFTPDMSEFSRLQASGALNRFESILVETSALLVAMDLDALQSTPIGEFIRERAAAPFTIQREIVLAQFENLKLTPAIPGPKFVFVHILPPHGPHLFGRRGEEIDNEGAFTLLGSPESASETDQRRYVDSLVFVSNQLQSVIETILNEPDRPVIIVLQSDHGPSHNLDWDNPTAEALEAKVGILNALYLPEECSTYLHASMTPVNTFRVISNCVFQERMQLLEDQTFVGYDTYVPMEEFMQNELSE
jgi:hypothetical protein